MSAAPSEVNTIVDAIPSRRVPMPVLAGAGLAIVVGIVCFVVLMMQDKSWAWGAYLVGLLYTLALSMGGIMFSVVGTLTWARWSRPLKRVAESFSFFFPVAFVLMIVFLLAGIGLYRWNPDTFVSAGPVDLHPHSKAVWFAAKPGWLSKPAFIGRLIFGVGLMMVVGLIYIRASLRPDMLMAKARLGDRAPGWWGSLIGSPRDLTAEIDAGQNTQSTLAVVLAILYPFVASMIAFDMIMSLAPWWYSNLFGGWYFSNSFLMTMAFIGLFTMLARDWLGLRAWIAPKVTHDLGKLLLAFTMAYAYMAFAQILAIWYADMPEETDFLLVRLSLPQWAWMTRSVAVLVFLAPFVILVSRGLKKMRWPFAALCTVTLTGLFLDRTILIMPSVYFGDTFPTLYFVLGIGVFAGFMGAFVLVVTWALSQLPVLVISDPKLQPHPWDVHVHPTDFAHMTQTHH